MRRLSTLSSLPAGALKSTLLLPKTTFPIRPSPDITKHRAHLQKCTAELYARQSQRDPNVSGTFILHDGPPYANGTLHMGHALNKILKDIVNRVQVLEGKRVVFIPGWDCHGLPIELKALQKRFPGDATLMERGKAMSALEVRTLARELARETIAEQKKGFKEWAVMADWDRAYKTMDKHYEMVQLQVFHDMVQRGLVYRRFKPVYWSPSSSTALAEAELEYNEKHNSKAAFVRFLLNETVGDMGDVGVVVWTTTPWTIPANKAVAVGVDLEYVILKTPTHGKLIVAHERVEHLRSILGKTEPVEVIKTGILGADLVGLSYTHPLLPASSPPHPIIAADFVSTESGTGLVHLAPGHGMEDYLVCLTHKIAPFSPVDSNGHFTADTLPELVGKEVLYSGTKAVLELLESSNALVHVQKKFTHKYPYDWRTKLPVIVRATAQWFADVEGIKADAVAALEDVCFIPDNGRARLTAFVKGRNEWCISRQRAWGVPIPALYDAETREPLLTEQSVNHIVSVLQEHGTDAWFTPEVPDSLFLAPEYRDNGKTYVRGQETMDVWFDSGTSWASLSSRMQQSNGPEDVVADLYLEGTDQNRGWFQSSLITSIAARSKPPFKSVLTHGFCLDNTGKKMSKSLGNVVLPHDITNSTTGGAPNIDILRLWVAHCDFTKDVSIGTTVISHIHEVLRKARVTSRFLLGILSDLSPDAAPIPYHALPAVDQFALSQLSHINASIRAALSSYNFNKAISLLATYTSVDLSASWLDIIKDRVYSSSPRSPARAAAQYTATMVLRNYASLLAPFVPLLTQEIWAHAPPALLAAVPEPERAMLHFFTPDQEWSNPALIGDFEQMGVIYSAVRLGVERSKAAGRIKVNLETQVEVVCKEEWVRRYEAVMEEAFIVSGVRVVAEASALGEGEWEEVEKFELKGGEKGEVRVRKSAGEKCVRCWVYKASTTGGVCTRCMEVLKGLGVEGAV